MNPLASPPYTSSDSTSLSSSYQSRHMDPAMRSLLASTWQVLEQPPPPSLREILGAYKSKGDGDRDMLLAMLQAKSAEDQRLASVASLHKTMIEINQCPAPHLPQLNIPDGARPPFSPQGHHTSFSPSHQRESPGSSPKVTLPSIRDHPSPSENPRKRMRSSRSPSMPSRHPVDGHSASHHDFPPSPYSSSSQRSLSAESSHSQQRGSMAIGALLSSSKVSNDNDDAWNPQLSSERSSTRTHHDHPGRGYNTAAALSV